VDVNFFNLEIEGNRKTSGNW